MDIQELNEFYNEADAADQSLFAEQRSNVLLVTGQHYGKRSDKFWQSIRRMDTVAKDQKIRLTKNHIHKISRAYVNTIINSGAGVFIGPYNEDELADTKAAELNNAVWQDMKERHKLRTMFRLLAHDYIEIGEAIVKVFFDTQAGHFLGYEPVTGEDGAPQFDENGNPAARAVFTGDVVFERILGFNLLRDPCAKSWEESKAVCYRKMVPVKELKAQFRDDEERLQFVQESSDKTYQVFDASRGGYTESKDMVMVREYYFKASSDHPHGYYYISTEAGVLYEGDLPNGIFPIRYLGFDQVATYARSFSIIKQLRPYQAEINRAASKIAEHQITLGDDKLILQSGGSITPGGSAHGVKAIKVMGQTPTILPGRAGDQFVGYMQSQIDEMYQIANVVEENAQKDVQQDPYAALFRNIREKKKFSLYQEKWEDFQKDVCETALELGKAFYQAEMVVPVFGKKELVNIPEWKATDKLSYQIKVEPSGDDVESKMGKQLSLNHIVQYAGQNMSSGDLGKIIRSMPYVNKEEMFSDLTLDYDIVTNDILAMDRGAIPLTKRTDNHEYYIKRLTHRMKQADFPFLPPQVQRTYEEKLKAHEQMLVQLQQEAAAAQAGFIPTGGYLVACDIYIPDARDPTKMPRRARIPFESVQWLLKKIEQQGMTQASIQAMSLSTVADMAAMGLGQTDPTGAPLGGQGQGEVMPGQQMLNAVAVGAG